MLGVTILRDKTLYLGGLRLAWLGMGISTHGNPIQKHMAWDYSWDGTHIIRFVAVPKFEFPSGKLNPTHTKKIIILLKAPQMTAERFFTSKLHPPSLTRKNTLSGHLYGFLTVPQIGSGVVLVLQTYVHSPLVPTWSL